MNALWLVPLLPLISAVILILGSAWLGRRAVAVLGVGSVGLAALLTARVVTAFLGSGEASTQVLWTWMAVGDFSVQVAAWFDGLTAVMMSVITGVGFLIHLYSARFMAEDDSYARYFAYLNLFVAAMLVLVMADNLLLLYLGWEGVGACSYLLVGFWYKDVANGAAARKAFIVTRVGDTAMALGLFLILAELGTLNIQSVLQLAPGHWATGDTMVVLATVLLLGGAVGKSAQLPLHTWLPDAMAGPTPVSALIHAATMVTAGVYLIARTHGLFLLAPTTLEIIAWLGVLTALLAACSALVQTDIKRILAWSTISQIGYMFLALGVGAFGAAIFHLVTHAFFKALLFLAAGAVIYCLHHEHNIFRMGGLRSRMPVTFVSFLLGASALAAIPFTSGFYSKDVILLAAWQHDPLLFVAGLCGAALTAFYSFRLLFVAFFGPAQQEPDRTIGWVMAVPLGLLCVGALAGGALTLPLTDVFPPAIGVVNHTIEYIAITVTLAAVGLAAWRYLRQRPDPASGGLREFWFAGWRVDALYELLWVRPYCWLAKRTQGEPVDHLYNGIVALARANHRTLSALQTGQLRWYATGMVFGLVVLLAVLMRAAL